MEETVQTLASLLPFLPGNDFKRGHPPLNQRKSHPFDYCNGVPVFRKERPGIGGSPLQGQDEEKPQTSAHLYPKHSGLTESVPAWVAFDRMVLRFFAYFQEPVYEKREENYRIRKVSIYFYLEDDSVHVSEPKVPNSGIPQGVLIRRHRIPLPDSPKEQHYTVGDFNVGKEVTFYSRNFLMIGCDAFTRNFLGKLGVAVPQNTDYPTDPYTVQRAEVLSRMKPTHPKVRLSSDAPISV